MYIFYFSDYIYVIFGRVEFLHYNTYFQQIANPGKVWSMQLSSQVSYMVPDPHVCQELSHIDLYQASDNSSLHAF